MCLGARLDRWSKPGLQSLPEEVMQEFRVQRKQEFRVNRKAVEGGHGWRERGIVKSHWLGRGQSEGGEPAFSLTPSPPTCSSRREWETGSTREAGFWKAGTGAAGRADFWWQGWDSNERKELRMHGRTESP